MDDELLFLLQAALDEDMPSGDITSELMVPKNLTQTAHITSKASGVFYGTEIISGIFDLLDSNTQIVFHHQNGDRVTKGDEVVTITGKSRVILKAERVMLNLIQRLSGIATRTSQFVAALDDATIQVLDTRKTTPLFRFLERPAVVAGGGFNHRLNLSDMVLIKENHLAAFLATSQHNLLPDLFDQMHVKSPGIKIEIEIESLEQLRIFDLAKVDIIMFDNFSLEMIREGVQICHQKSYTAKLEVSGNVTLASIGQYKGIGIDRISVGSLTHTVEALDLSLRIEG